VQAPAIGLETFTERSGRGEEVVEQVQLTDLVTVHYGHRDVRITQRTFSQLEQGHGVLGGKHRPAGVERPGWQPGVAGQLPRVSATCRGRAQ
jgi:hypothetical protein